MNMDNSKYCFEDAMLESMAEIFKEKKQSNPESTEVMERLICYIDLMRESNMVCCAMIDYIAQLSNCTINDGKQALTSTNLIALNDWLKKNGLPDEFRSIYLRMKCALKNLGNQDMHFIATMNEAGPFLNGVEITLCYTQYYSSWQILRSLDSLFNSY